MKYLIVDDNRNMRNIIKQVICTEEDTVAECSDGDSVIDAYTKFQPDIVLMDIEMGRVDGIEATKKIKEKFPAARIIIITDYATPSFSYAAMKEGALGFFSKEDLYEVKNYIKSYIKLIINKEEKFTTNKK